MDVLTQRSGDEAAGSCFEARANQEGFGYKTLIQRRDRVLRWVRSQGMALCYDEARWARLELCLRDVVSALPDVFRQTLQLGVCAIFLYRQSVQQAEFATTDGQCFKDVTRDGQGVLYAIGISAEALEQGADCVALVILHELAHVIHGGDHDAAFHAALDDLIEQYNAVTGSHVVNDYYGLN